MSQDKNPMIKWLFLTWSATFLISILITAGLMSRGEVFKSAFKATAHGFALNLRYFPGDDSWEPMLKAYEKKKQSSTNSMYDVFFTDHVKFQYPPSALLIFLIFPPSIVNIDHGEVNGMLMNQIYHFSQGIVLMTVLICALILILESKNYLPSQLKRDQGIQLILSAILGVTFYPLIKAHQLGQIQVMINLLVACAVLFYCLGLRMLAGVCVGFCCLIKPQYGLVLIWGLLRRQWKFLTGSAAILLTGLVVSIVTFGFQDHIDYLRVLQILSRFGEYYWPNQSVNGLLNRMQASIDPTFFPTNQFAPYHPVVYLSTVVSSGVIMLLALWSAPRELSAGRIDFSIILAAATISSPIAWEHHYGSFLPIFAVSFPLLASEKPLGRATLPLFLMSYVMMADIFLRPEMIFRNRWVGLIGSHLFFGALILFSMLLLLRNRNINGAKDRSV